MSSSVSLVRYDAACKAIAEAKAVDEAKEIRDLSIAMRAYARQAKNKELEADAWEIRMRAERRVGELIKAQKATVGLAKPPSGKGQARADRRVERGPDALPTLAEAGIDKHLADRARKLTRADEEEFEQRLIEGRSRILDTAERVRVDLSAPTAHVGQNSGENEWYTPAHFVEPARKLLGVIDLDPASTPEANKIIKAKRIFTKDDDGLAHEWKGSVWMNPPYAQPLVDQFAKKLVASVEAKTVPAAVVLVNNATETAWFTTIAGIARAACFPQGRVRFWNPNKESATPLQGQALLYIGGKAATFHALFGELGTVWVKP